MTRFLLVRHAAHDLLGRRITGRAPGVHLSDEGRAQAERLAERLARLDVAAVYTSPLERTRETAQPVARRLGLEPRESEALLEVDYGEWTGRPFEELERDERWRRYNGFRSGTRIPGGELMSEVQGRVAAAMEGWRERHADGTVVLVSHGDAIKSAVAYWLGVPLDLLLRIEISPASVSVVELGPWGARVRCMNVHEGALEG